MHVCVCGWQTQLEAGQTAYEWGQEWQPELKQFNLTPAPSLLDTREEDTGEPSHLTYHLREPEEDKGADPLQGSLHIK